MSARTLAAKLVRAVYQKDYASLDRHLNEVNINLPDEEGGLTLLMLAVSADEDADPRMAAFLIGKGANVHLAEGGESLTALHFAAREAREDLVRVLLAAGADVNAQDSLGYTPLHHVVTAANSEPTLVSLLLEHGADSNKKENRGLSPIDLAKESGRSDLF